MVTRQTEYALRDGVHVGYQVWGAIEAARTGADGRDAPVDVLEFNSGVTTSWGWRCTSPRG